MEMQKTVDEAQASPTETPEDLPSIANSEGKKKISRKLSTRKKKRVCDRKDCNRAFRLPSELR